MTVPLQCIWEAIDRSRASLWAEPDRHVAWITRDIVSLPKVVCRVKSSHRRPFYSHLAITRVSSYGQLNLLVETTLANLSWTDIDDTFVKMFDVSHGNRFFNSTLRDWRQFSFLFFFFFYKTAWIKKSEEWLTPENATRESNTNFRSVFLFLEESVAIWENPRVGGTALARKQQDAF